MLPHPIGKHSNWSRIYSKYLLFTTGPIQCWVERAEDSYPLLEATESGDQVSPFPGWHTDERDVDVSGNADIGSWTEDLYVKQCLEGSRIYLMLVKSWAIDGENVASSCSEQKPCEREPLLLAWEPLCRERKKRTHGEVWVSPPPCWAKTS